MTYGTHKLLLLILACSMTTGLSVHGMEQEQITCLRPDNVMAVSDTQTMLNYFWQLPQELRYAIFLLFLESSLSYNFTCFQVLEGHTDIVTSAAYSPDGNTVLTGSKDYTACLWDATTGKQLHLLTGHTDWVYSVAYSPDSKTVLTGSMDKTACLWDVTTGKQLHTLKGHTDMVQSVAYSPDGKTILTGSVDKTACLWDATTG
ncbi:WD40 repeat domain-containing protein, partial [Candidatus Dependentiae bacterium]|nr:WD40 repeat domain-containing protein [Candidatus Dependentiae bacterium]